MVPHFYCNSPLRGFKGGIYTSGARISCSTSSVALEHFDDGSMQVKDIIMAQTLVPGSARSEQRINNNSNTLIRINSFPATGW